MTLPNFLIIGAMKAGTTVLNFYLDQHPQIYMSPQKEPAFFSFEGEDLYSHWPDDQKGVISSTITDITTYRSLFKGVSTEEAVGEVSHWYLYSPKAPERIQYYVPDAKLIAILRNPAYRAYSHFLHSVRTGTERLTDFAQALQEEEAGDRADWDYEHYVDRGFYHAQLRRYFDAFDQSQIRIYLYEDLSTDPAGVLQDMFRFLRVDKTFLPDVSAKRNVSGIPKNKALDGLLDLLRRNSRVKRSLKQHLPLKLWLRISGSVDTIRNRNLVKPQPLGPEVRQQLIEIYRDDILELQKLIGRDLSGWLK